MKKQINQHALHHKDKHPLHPAIDTYPRLTIKLGFILLAMLVLLLYGFILYEAWLLHSLGGILVLLVLCGLSTGLWFEVQSANQNTAQKTAWRGLLLTLTLASHGAELAVVVICASFTGMSSAERLPSLNHITLAGLVTGIIFLYSMPVFGGAGGKLGTIAFGASLAVYGYQTLLIRLSNKHPSPPK